MSNPAPSHADAMSELRFKQYKMMVDSAERNSDRRANAHRFYTTIHTSLLTLLVLVGGYGLVVYGITGQGAPLPGHDILGKAQTPVIIAVCVLGIALCALWRLHLNAFRRLSTAKYAVILAMEKDLPYTAFQDEWEALQKRRHVQLTTLESAVPIAAALLYAALAVIYIAVTQNLLL